MDALTQPASPAPPSAAIAIRAATPDDYDEIWRLHQAAWWDTYHDLYPQIILDNNTEEKFQRTWTTLLRERDKQRSTVLVATVRSDIVGVLHLSASDEADNVAEIQRLHVLPQYHRRGYGRALLTAAADCARSAGYVEVMLWAVANNYNARFFYEAMGWKREGFRDLQTEVWMIPEVGYRLPLVAAVAPEDDTLRIEQVDPANPAARALMAMSDRDFLKRCTDPSRTSLPDSDHGQFRPPQGFFLVAFRGEDPAGCLGLQLHSLGGEVKYMYVEQSMRRRGVARALLAELEARARTLGIGQLVLETGPNYPEAMKLYRSCGFRMVASFPPYTQCSSSICFSKLLE